MDSRSVLLDVGCGERGPRPGHIGVDRRLGSEAFPLRYADESVDGIVASHLLEHFPDAQLLDVLKDWVRALKPGGQLRIAVPDFQRIAQRYLAGEVIPTASLIMGGQEDANDFHRSVFDRGRLKQLMSDAGLVLIRPWKSEIEDCANYNISLNLEGTKPFVNEIKVSAVMSVPRLGFMDNFGCCIDGILPLGIKLRRQGGAFWGQALTKAIETAIEQDQPDAILTLDYDSIFTVRDVSRLMQLMLCHPEADAIVALQSSRHQTTALFTKKGDDDKPIGMLDINLMQPDLMKIATAHFGLTLIRTEKLLALPRPWFISIPDAEGRWEDEKKVDEDIYFWMQWEKAGNSLYLASHVPIGHAELMVRWPGKDLQAIYQPIREFNETHKPPTEAWD